jgi:D-3-phosphoglycerate dehydrogenase
MAGQLTASSDGAIRAIRVEYEGHAGELNRRPLTAAALAGVLGPLLGAVNMVNAPVVAKERGIEVAETTHERSGEYQTLLRLTVVSDRFERSVAGTLVAGDKPRLVDIKGIAVEADFAPHMLYVTNQDRPGFIGQFGMVLAQAGINIATFHLGRSAPGGDAICLVGLDGPMPEVVLAEVRRLPLVVQATPLAF